MGFRKSFWGSLFAQAVNNDRKQQQELDNWNRLFGEALDADIEFGKFLLSKGITTTYVSPYGDLADAGRSAVNAEKRKLEILKKKINEYLSLGGHPDNIWDVEIIDEYLAKLKFLISQGLLNEQDNWLDWDIELLKTRIPAYLETKRKAEEAEKRNKEYQRRHEFLEKVGINIDGISGIEFENICQALVEKMGFSSEMTSASRDGGIDIIATNNQPLLSGKYIIQCKRYSGSIGEPIIRDLYGVVTSERANKGILMTTGHFTSSSIRFAEGKPIELIDGIKLKELLLQYTIQPSELKKHAIDKPIITTNNTRVAATQLVQKSVCTEYETLDFDPENDPLIIKSICELVEKVYTDFAEKLEKNLEISCTEVKKTSLLLQDNLQELIKYYGSHLDNTKTRTKYFKSLLLDAECSVFSGDFLRATDRYCKVLQNWDRIEEDNYLGFTCVLYSLFGIFKLINCPDLIDRFYSKYLLLIDEAKLRIERAINKGGSIGGKQFIAMNQELLKILNNHYDVTQYMLLSPDGFFSECVNQWGEIRLGIKYCRIDINKSCNWLFFCSEPNWKSQSQETVLIKDFSKVAESEQNIVREISELYL